MSVVITIEGVDRTTWWCSIPFEDDVLNQQTDTLEFQSAQVRLTHLYTRHR